MSSRGLHPLVLGATAAAVLSALGARELTSERPRPVSAAPSVESRGGVDGVHGVHGVDGLLAPCASGTLPEGPVCLRIPSFSDPVPREPPQRGAAPRRDAPSAERIPRRPERPADPTAYLYPAGSGRLVEDQDALGARVAVEPGEIARVVALTGQEGSAKLVFVGVRARGPSVATLHEVVEGPRHRQVLLLIEGLDHVAPGLVAGAEIAAGAELGAARSEVDKGLVTLYVEARELRDGAPPGIWDAKRVSDPAVSVVTDLRNVLTIR